MRVLLPIFTLVVALMCAACLPVPTKLYVADHSSGKIVYSSCPIDSYVPVGVELTSDDIVTRVSIAKANGRDFVEVRLGVPEGKTLVLDSGIVEVSTPNFPPSQSSFPNVLLSDYPIRDSYTDSPYMKPRQLPINTPLVGANKPGPVDWTKLFWLAAYIDTHSESKVWLTLPGYTVNGVQRKFAPILFRRKTIIDIQLFNC